MTLKNIIISFKIRSLKFILDNLKFFKFILNKMSFDPKKKRIFCIGLPRSGTHSMAKLLKDNFGLKGEHEPQASVVLDFIIKDKSAKEMEDFIIARDKILRHDFEASYYQILFIKHLVKLFPNSYYILTIRDPLDWVKSVKNNTLSKGYENKGIWGKFIFKVFGDINFDYNETKNKNYVVFHEQLEYYKKHIDLAITHIPKERLLVLDTYNINDKIKDISEFINVAYKDVNEKSHVAGNSYKNVLEISDDAKQHILDICKYFSKKGITQFDTYSKELQ